MNVLRRILILFLLGQALFAEYNESLPTLFSQQKESYLQSENIWLGIYRNKKEHLRIQARVSELSEKIAQQELRKPRPAGLRELKKELGLLKEKLLLSEKVDKQFSEEIALPTESLESISVGLISYLFKTHLKKITRYEKQHEAMQKEYQEALGYFDGVIHKVRLLESQARGEKDQIATFLHEVQADKHYFEIANELVLEQAHTLQTYRALIQRKYETYSIEELPKTLFALLFLVTLVVILIYSRRLIRKTIQDEDRQFAYANTVQITLIVMILIFGIFFYSENLTYAATLLGLVGAALVVVSKEMVFSFPAWLYILFTGCIRVGDRIQYQDQFRPHIGDIIAISPFRVTLYETINHITATELKRAGRILYFPTHYIFTRSIYNFTHEDMKTILDLIEIDFEFSSDHEKAEQIAIDVTLEMTGKYIDLASRQYESLKNRYQMRNFNPKPQIQFLMNNEEHCVRMYLWYIAPYREMLNVRSQVTMGVLKAYDPHPEIKLITHDFASA